MPFLRPSIAVFGLTDATSNDGACPFKSAIQPTIARIAPTIASISCARRCCKSGALSFMAPLLLLDLRSVVAAAGELLLTQRGGAEHAAHTHRLDGAARDEHQRALLLQSFVQHVHRAQMERRWIVMVRLGGLGERMRDFHFRLPEDDPRLLLAR